MAATKAAEGNTASSLTGDLVHMAFVVSHPFDRKEQKGGMEPAQDPNSMAWGGALPVLVASLLSYLRTLDDLSLPPR